MPGPGRVTSIRPRVANLTLRRGAEPPAALPPPSPGGKLACLDVRFQDSLSGDINNRKLVFHDQVQSVYGDVASCSRGSTSTIPIRWERPA